MPTNLYGPNDNFDLEKSHVLPALIRKIYLAKLLAENKKDAIIKDLEVADFEQAKAVLTQHGISAKTVKIWGSGKPLREFIFIDDFIDACMFLIDQYNSEGIINAGSGEEISVAHLTELIAQKTGYKGKVRFDESKPDGVSRKFLNSQKINQLGWKAKVSLSEGIDQTLLSIKEEVLL